MMSNAEKGIQDSPHRAGLDNDPQSAGFALKRHCRKVPTAYVVWTATSGCEAIERCQDANGHVSLLILDMSMEGLQGPRHVSSVAFDGQHADFRRSVRASASTIVIGTSWLRLVRKGWLVRRMPTSWRRLLLRANVEDGGI